VSGKGLVCGRGPSNGRHGTGAQGHCQAESGSERKCRSVGDIGRFGGRGAPLARWNERVKQLGGGGTLEREIARKIGLQYTGTVTQDPCADETAVQAALRRQIEDPEDHDVSLIEECLGLTPDKRLQRLTIWVAFVASARPIEGLATGGRD